MIETALILAAVWRSAEARALRWGLAVALCLAFAWLSGCGGCPTAYRDDGGATARRHYKVALCPGKPVRVVCDSPDKLPNSDCE